MAPRDLFEPCSRAAVPALASSFDTSGFRIPLLLSFCRLANASVSTSSLLVLPEHAALLLFSAYIPTTCMLSGGPCQLRRGAAVLTLSSPSATPPFQIRPLAYRLRPCRLARRLPLGARVSSSPRFQPPFYFCLRVVFRASHDCPLLHCSRSLCSEVWSSESTTLRLRPHRSRWCDLKLECRKHLSINSEFRRCHGTINHYWIFHRAFPPNLQNFLSCFYVFRTLHITERSPSHLELVVISSDPTTLPSTFAQHVQKSHALPRSKRQLCRYSYSQFIKTTC